MIHSVPGSNVVCSRILQVVLFSWGFQARVIESYFQDPTLVVRPTKMYGFSQASRLGTPRRHPDCRWPFVPLVIAVLPVWQPQVSAAAS
jgi:hypothetical protein